ncbi:MAG: 3-deoxy-D-manno-octulosonic acid transferase [Candidatus Omnitrophica bacterium]|nr:3-deoxy-D-manno-octulosonic acid transferase [Candidatus Omnitrophota bacterium]
MFILYDFIFLIFVIAYIPVLFIKKKWHADFKMRFGVMPVDVRNKIKKTNNIWIHAVSVGEVLAVCDLIVRVGNRFPEHHLIVTTVTKTGNDLAKQKLIGKNVTVLYAPLDLSWIVRKFIKIVNPRIYISAETEFWPNLFYALTKKKVPIVLVNGRISDRSFSHYQLAKWLMKPVLNCVARFCMQSPTDAQRVCDLGVDRGRVEICGNLKFDLAPITDNVAEEYLKLPVKYQFIIGGSTHDGEEDILSDVYKDLTFDFPDVRLIITPRHVERADELVDLMKRKGFVPIKYSSYKEGEDLPANSVIIVDVIGKLRSLYRLATLVFMGKSLTAKGGQNMIEPAAFGKPILVGPNTQNFKDVMTLFLSQKAIIRVKNPEELSVQIKYLLKSPKLRAQLGDAAKKTLEIGRGATDRTMAAIIDYLQ